MVASTRKRAKSTPFPNGLKDPQNPKAKRVRSNEAKDENAPPVPLLKDVPETADFDFDKTKAVEDVKNILKSAEGEGSEAKNSGKVIEHGSNQRKLFMQLKQLRTTEVEQLLEDVRTTAATRETAQQKLIDELTAEVMRLKEEKAAGGKSDNIKWKEEYIQLKRKNDQMKEEIQQLHSNGASSDTPSTSTNAELEACRNVCKFYQELTALKVQIEGSTGVCIATNRKQRKAVKFEIKFCEGEDNASSFKFTATANKKLLPEDLQVAKVYSHNDAQKVLSRVWKSLDKA